MKIARLMELIALASSRGIGSIDIVEDGTRVRISRRAATTESPPAAPPFPGQVAPVEAHATAGAVADDSVVAPMFGVLHLTPAPGAAPFVQVGERVEPGRRLCLVEAMKMFSPVESDRAGRVEAILAATGEEVSAGQPLFRIVASSRASE